MSDADLVSRAASGDRGAFDVLVDRHHRAARHAVRRLVGHPEDVDEVVQEALLKAWRGVDRFRGEAAFGTWLVQIASRTALDHLKRKRRWRVEAQPLYAQGCRGDPEAAAEVGRAMTEPGSGYDAREHIAFCFTCVARTLRPEQQVAVVLRDVVGLTNVQAARAAGLTHGGLRTALSEGRAELTTRFEGLCALVNKDGVCWQCAGLREAAPPEHRGPEVPEVQGPSPSARYQARLGLVRAANLDTGVSQALHDLFFRRIDDQEERCAGTLDEDAAKACRPP